MSRTAEIEKVAMMVQLDGKPYTVALPHDKMMILVNMAASLSDSGNLPVLPAPEGVGFVDQTPPRRGSSQSSVTGGDLLLK